MLFGGSRDNDHVYDCDSPAKEEHLISVVWSLSSLGDPKCSDSRPERLKVGSIFLSAHLTYIYWFDQIALCRYVGMSVYNVTIMCVLGVAISAVLNEHPNASFVLISVFIIFCTTGTLCLVFVPKVAPAYFLLSFSHYLIGLFPSSFLSHFLSET